MKQNKKRKQLSRVGSTDWKSFLKEFHFFVYVHQDALGRFTIKKCLNRTSLVNKIFSTSKTCEEVMLKRRRFYYLHPGSPRHLTSRSSLLKIPSSRLDYCNSILYGLPKQQLDKLQRIQNSATRLITGTKRYEHIKPALRELHRLPAESRMIFKVLLIITFKILPRGLCPAYLSSLLQQYHPQRSLHSSSKLLFTVPSVNSVLPFLSPHLYYVTVYRILLEIQHLFHLLNLPSKYSCFGNFSFDWIYCT